MKKLYIGENKGKYTKKVSKTPDKIHKTRHCKNFPEHQTLQVYDGF